jgi:ribosomal protein S18 acetylase RimI-like enzyme
MTATPNSSPSRRADLGETAFADDRKLGRLKRRGLFGDDTKGATIRRACTADELSQAYRLVHDVFLRTGFLRPEPSGLRVRLFETTSETATFIAEKDGEIVGVLSVVGDSQDLGLPSDAAFKPELDELRAKGRRLCELTNQAVNEKFRDSAVSTELMRCAIAHGIQAGFDESVAAVSPSHRSFYEMVGFGVAGAERSYSAKLHDPVIAVRLDLGVYRNAPEGRTDTARFIRHFAAEGNPFLSRVVGWGALARRNFLSADLLEKLFVTDRNFLAECTREELGILERRWGREMFQIVAGAGRPQPEDEAAGSVPAYGVAAGLGFAIDLCRSPAAIGDRIMKFFSLGETQADGGFENEPGNFDITDFFGETSRLRVHAVPAVAA